MRNLYQEHKADSCIIAEIFSHVVGENGDKHKRLINQRIFCEKKCKFTNCSEYIRSYIDAR